MTGINYFSYLFKILGYKSFRAFGLPKMLPSNAVYSVTNLCNSKCKTCDIWKKYVKQPKLREKELSTEQWIRIWESMGKVDYCTFTGGEPFLRKDVLELLFGLYENNKPKILNICTNGMLTNRIIEVVDSFLNGTDGTMLNVNLSIDGIKEKHDEIRGVKGNWNKAMETIKSIKKIQGKHSTLNLTIHTVVSKWNVEVIPETHDYIVKELQPDIHIMEPAELRYELGTIGTDILPPKEKLAKVFRVYSSGRNMSKITELVRKIYINYYVKGNGLPCYATFNHTQITTNGNVWPCCIIADNHPLGNLHNHDYNFKTIWFSDRANEVREIIKNKAFLTCDGCYLAVAANTSIPQNLILTGKYALKQLFKRN